MCEGNCKECQESEPEVKQPERRKLLGAAVAAINLAVAAAVVGPVLGFIGSPLKRKATKGSWHAVLNESDIAVGETKKASFVMPITDGYMVTNRKFEVFVRRRQDQFECFDPTCTHMGCSVNYYPNRKEYICPCHGGVYDENGNVVSGPPPLPLMQHQIKLEKGTLWVYMEV